MVAPQLHTRVRYQKGCKCSRCKRANTDYMRNYREKKKAAKAKETEAAGSVLQDLSAKDILPCQ